MTPPLDKASMNLAMFCWLTSSLVRCVNKKAPTDIPSTQGIVRVRFQMACSAIGAVRIVAEACRGAVQPPDNLSNQHNMPNFLERQYFFTVLYDPQRGRLAVSVLRARGINLSQPAQLPPVAARRSSPGSGTTLARWRVRSAHLPAVRSCGTGCRERGGSGPGVDACRVPRPGLGPVGSSL